MNNLFKLLVITFFIWLSSSAHPNSIQKSNQVIVHKGTAITNQIYTAILKIVKESYVYNEDHLDNNLKYIQKQLKIAFPGQWNIIINQIYSPKSSKFYVPENNQWWLMGASINSKKQHWTYYMQKIQKQYTSQQQMHYVYNIDQYTFGSGLEEQDKRVIQNLMNFVQKKHDREAKVQELRNELQKYFNQRNWNILNMEAFVGRARFAAKDKKYFVVNTPLNDYLIFLS